MSNETNMCGDAEKLREALAELIDVMYELGIDENTIAIAAESKHCHMNSNSHLSAIKKAKAALAAPPRNCDVYTADELKVKFNSELASELPIANEHEKNLVTITAMGVINTLFAPATEQEGVNDADK